MTDVSSSALEFRHYARRAAWVLLFVIGVILFGTFVRATGSGAGCGSHWPLCNGNVQPFEGAADGFNAKTAIEFTHRLTSGLSFILVGILYWTSRRRKAFQGMAKSMASASWWFMVVEVLIGALLVLKGLVAENDSMWRAIIMPVHLINSMLLVGSLSLCWLALRRSWLVGQGKLLLAEPAVGKGLDDAAPRKRQESKAVSNKKIPQVLVKSALKYIIAFDVLVVAFLLLSASGAIVALGDTLFPSQSLAEGIAQDFHPEAHFLLKLRIWHPPAAILISLGWIMLAIFVRNNPIFFRFSMKINAVAIGFGAQIFVGFLNLALLAPVWMQILHLFVAVILMVLIASAAFEVGRVSRRKLYSGTLHSLHFHRESASLSHIA